MTNKFAGSYESTVKKIIIIITVGILSEDTSVFDELSRVLKNSNLKNISPPQVRTRTFETFVSLFVGTEAMSSNFGAEK